MKTSPYNKMRHTLLSLVFLLIIFAVLAQSYLRLDVERSIKENRALATAPASPLTLKDLQEWPKKYQSYFEDQFGFRSWLISGFNQLQVRFFKESPSDRIVIGDKKWLYWASSIRENQISDTRTNALYSSIKIKQELAESAGAQFLFFIAPNKSSLYPENLPWPIRKRGVISAAEKLNQKLKEKGEIPFVDIQARLRRKASKGEELYAKGESHWKDKGALLVYQAVISAIAQDIEMNQPYKKSQLSEVRNEVVGDLAGLLGMNDYFREEVESLKLPASPCTEGHLSPFMNKKWPQQYWRDPFRVQCPDQKPIALIIGDSFTRKTLLWKLLAHHFSESTFVHRLDLTSSTDYQWLINTIKPTVVIYEQVERSL